jgi:DHA1 family bicyclomycin/chloramphenicol resistance-like MFS transporter
MSGNKFFLILILGILTALSPFSIDMYLPAFPQIAADFKISVAQVALSLSSYFVGLAIGQVFYGPLLDRFGRKRPLYVGLIIYVLAAFGCLVSRSSEMLILFRFVQALGGCAASVAAMAMVRDFFPVQESSKVFSLLMLILGSSPLFAPTVGGFIATVWGWQAIFIMLALIGLLILAAVFLFLPEGHQPDPTISLQIKPILRTFKNILKEPQFFTYAISGTFAFAGLFAYVAGSPILFLDVFHVSAQVYGAIFAFLSLGFIGASQINILLVRKYQAENIFRGALIAQAAIGLVFMIGTALHWYGLVETVICLGLYLACVGFANPNATALALAPFSRNAGSASALMGFLQIGIGAAVSMIVGLLNSDESFPVIATLGVSAMIGVLALWMGQRRITQTVEVTGSTLG